MEDLVEKKVKWKAEARGFALILCNDYLLVDKRKSLYGALEDARKMESTFNDINFAIIRKDNATRDVVISLIRKVTSYKFPDNYESIVVIFSGHGNGKPAIISSDDKELNLNTEIIEPLGVSETLEKKNKMVFISACRDKRTDDEPLDVQNKVLVAFPTKYGTGAAEDDNGCPWMQRLADEIRISPLTIEQVLIKISQEVKEVSGQDSQYLNTSVNYCLGECVDALYVGLTPKKKNGRPITQ